VILHAVTFRWKEETGPQDVERLLGLLRRLPGRVPAVSTYRFGPDLGLGERNGDFAVVAEVADADALTAYLEHPFHLEIREQIKLMAESRTAVQIAV
jgi:hypothetical protein